MNKRKVASLIDHTLLKPTATENDIRTLCAEARKYGFASVCVNPINVALSSIELKDSGVKVCSVIGFPLGATPTESKVFEAANAVFFGADEIDMVIDIASALERNYKKVEGDIKEVVKTAKSSGTKYGKFITVKVILETCFLSDEIIRECCKLCVDAGADFVKTSTGFAILKDVQGNPLPNGATLHHVRLMRETVGNNFGVKASGGIRTASEVLSFIKNGANRIGTSSGVKIIEEWNEAEFVPGFDNGIS